MSNFNISGNTNIREREYAVIYLCVVVLKKNNPRSFLRKETREQPQHINVQSDYVDCLALNKPLI